MPSSFKILSVLGIDIELHWTFLLFIAAFLVFDLTSAFLLLTVFMYVTLHELSHSFVARQNRIRVKKIVLLPIGGMAMMDISNIKPVTEIKMAIAGPLFNFMMVALFYMLAYSLGYPLQTWLNSLLTGGALQLDVFQLFIFYSFYANLVLGYFNLFVPAFPMDGGRILRGALALKMDYLTATNVARITSLAIAMLLLVLGVLYGNFWIVIIAAFIAFGALSEYKTLVAMTSLKTVRVRDLLSHQFLFISAEQTLQDVVEQMQAMRQLNALIEDNGHYDILSIDAISRVPKTKWPRVKAGQIAIRIRPATLNARANGLFKRMQAESLPFIPVVDGGRLLGVVTIGDMQRMIKIKEVTG